MITFIKEVKELDTIYTEFKDNTGNEFIYEDGELKDIIINGKHVHIFDDGNIIDTETILTPDEKGLLDDILVREIDRTDSDEIRNLFTKIDKL
tara:strand:- start:206 stop:484 length:279 start_codon:yes stop_codon:yes gene_type:complete